MKSKMKTVRIHSARIHSARNHSRRNQSGRRRSGFSLLEVLLVLVILSVVAGAVGFALFASQDKAYANATKDQISTFKMALKTYRLNSGSYPATLDALYEQPADAKNWSQTLEEPVKPDPWGNNYQYKVTGQKFEIRSAGPDGQFNTDDDITS